MSRPTKAEQSRRLVIGWAMWNSKQHHWIGLQAQCGLIKGAGRPLKLKSIVGSGRVCESCHFLYTRMT